jgi:hypothetical protein
VFFSWTNQRCLQFLQIISEYPTTDLQWSSPNNGFSSPGLVSLCLDVDIPGVFADSSRHILIALVGQGEIIHGLGETLAARLVWSCCLLFFDVFRMSKIDGSRIMNCWSLNAMESMEKSEMVRHAKAMWNEK